MKQIKFISGYKHQLVEDYIDTIEIYPKDNINARFFTLSTNGDLTVKKGYAWNGTSGVIDTSHNLRASLVHDALYQMMRLELISGEKWRLMADEIFYKMCITDGVFILFARLYKFILNKFGNFAAEPKNVKKLDVLPKVNYVFED